MCFTASIMYDCRKKCNIDVVTHFVLRNCINVQCGKKASGKRDPAPINTVILLKNNQFRKCCTTLFIFYKFIFDR